MNSVEMLDYNNDGLYSQWEILEELPRPMHSAALVSSPQCKSLTLLGGFSTEVGLLKSIFTLEQGALESDNKGNWKNSTHTLLSTRSDFTIIPNIDNIFTCNDQ